MTRAFAVMLAATGCGTPTTHPAQPASVVRRDAGPDAPLDRDMPRLARRSVELYEAIVRAFREAGTSCPTATARLEQILAAYADVVAANAKVLHEGRAKALKAALVPHEDKLDAAARAIVQSPTLSACSTDAGFARTFDRLVGTPP